MEQEDIGLLTVPEAAKVLRISPAGIRRLITSKDIAIHRVRGSVRIARKDIVSYLNGARS